MDTHSRHRQCIDLDHLELQEYARRLYV